MCVCDKKAKRDETPTEPNWTERQSIFLESKSKSFLNATRISSVVCVATKRLVTSAKDNTRYLLLIHCD